MKTRDTEKVFIITRMEKSTEACTKWVKERVMVLLITKMEIDTRVIG